VDAGVEVGVDAGVEVGVDAETDAALAEEALVETADPEPDAEDSAAPSEDLSEVIEFTKSEQRADAAENEDEGELSEGLLGSNDEVSTKLDLARAYIDMGDPEGARSILEEVIEEGGADQKIEAESLISKLA